MTKDKLNIYQRMAGAMRDLTYIRKDDKAPGAAGGYTFVTHDVVTRKVREVLLKHGVICYPTEIKEVHSQHEGKGGKPVFMTQAAMSVAFVNIDQPTERIIVPTLGTGMDSQDKAVGKAISYAVKYAMLKAMMLETGDDPERDHHDVVGRKGTATGQDLYPQAAPPTQGAVDRTQPQCIGIGDIRQTDRCADLTAFAQNLLFFRMGKKGADLRQITLGAYEQAVRRLTELSDDQVEKLRAVDPGTSKNLTRLSRLGAKQYAPWLKLVLDRLHEGLDARERQWVQRGNFREMPPDWDAEKSAEHHAAVDAAEAALDAMQAKDDAYFGDIPLDPTPASSPQDSGRPAPSDSVNDVGTQPTPHTPRENGYFPECQLDRPEGFDLDQEVTIAGTVRTWKDWVRKEPDMLQNLVLSAKRGAGTDTKAWTDIARCALMALRLGNAT